MEQFFLVEYKGKQYILFKVQRERERERETEREYVNI
jgi:hypothetical protein